MFQGISRDTDRNEEGLRMDDSRQFRLGAAITSDEASFAGGTETIQALSSG